MKLLAAWGLSLLAHLRSFHSVATPLGKRCRTLIPSPWPGDGKLQHQPRVGYKYKPQALPRPSPGPLKQNPHSNKLSRGCTGTLKIEKHWFQHP